MLQTENLESKNNLSETSEIDKRCGIIMPISAMDGYSESHWQDVRRILQTAIENAGFETKIVSEADDIGVIHKRIVQNLYDNPIVVCDISGRNPNVMFELGLRLAFDKPTIIVKDDVTPYSFDTSVIEHLQYPKDLRYAKIGSFIENLTTRILQTLEIYNKDPSTYSTFLKNFGSFKVPKLDEKQIPIDNFLLEELKGIQFSLNHLESKFSSFSKSEYIDKSKKRFSYNFDVKQNYRLVYNLEVADDIKRNKLMSLLRKINLINSMDCQYFENLKSYIIDIKLESPVSPELFQNRLSALGIDVELIMIDGIAHMRINSF